MSVCVRACVCVIGESADTLECSVLVCDYCIVVCFQCCNVFCFVITVKRYAFKDLQIVMIIGMRLRFHLTIRRSKFVLLLHGTVIASGDFL